MFDQAVKQKQENIVKYVFECLRGNVSSQEYINKSYFGFYEGAADFGKVFSVSPN